MAETQYVLTQTKQGKKEWIPLPSGGVAPHNQAWSTITDTPTTLEGYGITDGGGSMTYPGTGIPKSTGAAWDTSYTTTGSGTKIVLSSSPELTGTVDINSGLIKINYASPIYGIGLSTTPVGSGGWARAYRFFKNSDGSLLGGFGALGGEDSLDDYWIGKDYNDLCARFYPDGASELYYDNSLRIATNSTGTAFTGNLKINDSSNAYSNYIYGGIWSANYRSGLIHDSNGSINWGINNTSSFVFRWLRHDTAVDYSDDNDEIMRLSSANGLLINQGLHVGGTSAPGDNNLWIDGIAQEPNFISGWQGNNWQIQADGDAEFNNVLIRGGLSVYELIINQLHYQNGGLIIGAGAGKVATIETATAGSEVLTFHDPEGNNMVPFTAGAIVMCQRVDISKTVANGYTGDVVKKIVRQVASVSGMEVTLTTTAGWTTGDDTGAFEVGDELCAIGHVSNTSLDSALYLSATDSDNPFLRVMDGVSSYAKWSLSDKSTVKLQLGNLASLASYDILPANPGYGLYTNNAYLSGTAKIGMSANGSGYGVVIAGPQIYEGLYHGDNSTLYINPCGYLDGTDHYRNTEICDGKGNMIVRFIGAATNKALFDGTVECDGIFQADGAATFNNYVTFNSLPSTWNIYFRLAQYTTAERDLLSGVGGSTWEGTLIMNTTTHKLNFWNGSAWKEVTSS